MWPGIGKRIPIPNPGLEKMNPSPKILRIQSQSQKFEQIPNFSKNRSQTQSQNSEKSPGCDQSKIMNIFLRKALEFYWLFMLLKSKINKFQLLFSDFTQSIFGTLFCQNSGKNFAQNSKLHCWNENSKYLMSDFWADVAIKIAVLID